MLHTTVRLALDADARIADFRKVARAFRAQGYTPDTPIPLTLILEHAGLNAAFWALHCVLPEEKAERDRIARLFACDCAERVLPLFERIYPDEKRPRQAIETARRFALGAASREEMAAARAAAWAAPWSAARAAAWAASWSTDEDADENADEEAALIAGRAAAWAASWATDLAADEDADEDAGENANAAWAAEIAEQTRIFLDLLNQPSTLPIS